MLRLVALREDDGFAAEGSAFGPADVEHIAQAGDVRKRDVGLFAREAVRQAGAVQVERHVVAAADGAEFFELRFAVQRAVLRRLGDVHHSREHHVLVVAVRIEAFDPLSDGLRFQLAVDVRQREDLVTGVLDGAGLVCGDMPRVRGDDAFIVFQKRRNDHGVCLRAADEELDVRVGTFTCHADLLLRAVAVAVRSIAGQLLEVRVCERLQHVGVCPGDVITFKRNHGVLL